MSCFTLMLVLVAAIAGASARGIDNGDSHSRVPVTVNLKRTETNSFKGHVRFHDLHHEVHLEKAEPVLTKNFQAFITSQDSTGRIVSTPTPFSPEEIVALEDDIYVDRNSHAVFSVQHDDGENVRLHGVLSGVHVTQDGDSHVAYIPREPRLRDRSDYVRSNRTLTYSNGYSPDTKGVTVAQPELFFTLDFLTFQSLGGNTNNVSKYVTIFVHDINNRYAQVDDPKLTFQLVGYNAVSDRASQSWLENSKMDGNMYLMDTLTTEYKKYLNDPNSPFPKFDSSPLLTGEVLTRKKADGTLSTGILGRSALGGACSASRWSINSDKNAFWQGVDTVIHEVAHNIGAPHDGDEGVEDCPWDDGNIMSYERWGEKVKFEFSKCSKRTMKAFVNSDQGACLRSQQSQALPAGDQNAGDIVSFDQQCKAQMNDPRSYFSYRMRPEELCRQLWCSVGGTDGFLPAGNMPADNTPCDQKDPSKKCWMGDCVSR